MSRADYCILHYLVYDPPMPKAKPTTIYMDAEDRRLAAARKEEFGMKSFTALVRHWLRMPPKEQ